MQSSSQTSCRGPYYWPQRSLDSFSLVKQLAEIESTEKVLFTKAWHNVGQPHFMVEPGIERRALKPLSPRHGTITVNRTSPGDSVASTSSSARTYDRSCEAGCSMVSSKYSSASPVEFDIRRTLRTDNDAANLQQQLTMVFSIADVFVTLSHNHAA